MIWAILTGNPIARAIAKVLGLVLAVLTFGAWQRRQGAVMARQRQAEAQAKADQQSHERMNHAETGANMSDDDRAKWLRDFAAKHGNRPPKAGGG